MRFGCHGISAALHTAAIQITTCPHAANMLAQSRRPLMSTRRVRGRQRLWANRHGIRTKPNTSVANSSEKQGRSRQHSRTCSPRRTAEARRVLPIGMPFTLASLHLQPSLLHLERKLWWTNKHLNIWHMPHSCQVPTDSSSSVRARGTVPYRLLDCPHRFDRKLSPRAW